MHKAYSEGESHVDYLKICKNCADMDGLLLNTEEFYTIVQKDILAKYGKEFTWALKAQV